MTARHLYIHVPFCSRRCSYCDFSIAVRRIVPVREYLDALAVELDGVRDALGPSLTTLYFGGGTPSHLGSAGVTSLVDLVRARVGIDDDSEITLETNPEDVTPESVSLWRNAGINRLSLGVQSFDDNALQWMHRTHSAADSAEAIATARAGGIENLSIDLIFALPESLNRSWNDDLEKAISVGPDHISLYGLTVERGTPLGKWEASGQVAAATEDRYAEQFLKAHEATTAAGFQHYEVSNFGKPGRRSRHNSAYWSGAHYVGVGPSAHSFDGQARKWNVAPYAAWQSRLSRGESVNEGAEVLTDDNRRSESVYLGLRTIDGYTATDSDLQVATRWTEHGWATIDGKIIRLSPEGWLRLDSLAPGLTGL
ncbi:MAG TPA: radical SAM family heme chaperone HemW [Gemmatimonadaceae bacterium]|nr:radical SAM family heme chaperone HemW [Gemmatimonadaceae bacterium]